MTNILRGRKPPAARTAAAIAGTRRTALVHFGDNAVLYSRDVVAVDEYVQYHTEYIQDAAASAATAAAMMTRAVACCTTAVDDVGERQEVSSVGLIVRCMGQMRCSAYGKEKGRSSDRERGAGADGWTKLTGGFGWKNAAGRCARCASMVSEREQQGSE